MVVGVTYFPTVRVFDMFCVCVHVLWMRVLHVMGIRVNTILYFGVSMMVGYKTV